MKKLTKAFALSLTLITGGAAEAVAAHKLKDAGAHRDEARAFMAKYGLSNSTVIKSQLVDRHQRVLTISSKPVSGAGPRLQSVVICHDSQEREMGTNCKFKTGGLPIAVIR